MKKISITTLILLLILSTAIIKNSTKKIDDDILVTKENLRDLKKEFEIIKLEFEYLSSTEKLLKFKDLYFHDDLLTKDINEIKIIHRSLDKIRTKKFNLLD